MGIKYECDKCGKLYDYKQYAVRNNSMIFLCKDCMRDFLKSLQIDVFGQ